ncbi:ABC transporter substrate-binding protein [Piscinibacter defluvii]|uniref:ABC transporter substrate-binding protein n=1 Tax=Piscinibacter defluvii TaxID=1796922 RepID=UPI00197C48D2|nr:ABC transporter substrate-binding protein [Piscinibacter defluvii]
MTRPPPQPAGLRRRTMLSAAALLHWAGAARAADWPAIERAARGQTVYFNAWAGSDRVNAYLQWAAAEVAQRFAIRLEHVKLGDTAELVKRVRAEKQAGRDRDGSADMVWINGENFLAMKREGLLFGPFAESLPAFRYVDTVGKPTTRIDFSEPVEGYEAAWGMAQFTFYGDARRVARPPTGFDELLAFAQAQPGRFTYPKPPNFHGTTFLKQVLVERVPDRAPLYRPAGADASALLAPLWSALESLHPLLWRQGRAFPANTAAMRQMLADGELHVSLTFNPNEAANEIAAKRLPDSVVSWQHRGGTIGNTHFLAIPYNARAREGAQVVIDFLQSPLAQARKADIRHWGDPTVLALDKLPPAERALFGAAPAPGSVREPAPVLPEPHGSWVEVIEREWARRHGQ